MDVLATKCILDHRNPIVKVNLPAQKLFFPVKNDEEKAFISTYQDQFKTLLNHSRVEKRCNRVQAIWLSEGNIGSVTKVVKNLLKFFGHQNKDGIFLYPEEILYLLETNRLEITMSNTSLSIKEAFEILLKVPNLNLMKYRIYKKLAHLGYKLVRHDKSKIKTKNIAKRKISKEDTEQQGVKHLRLDEVVQSGNSSNCTNESVTKENEYIQNLFRIMKEHAPKNVSTNWDKVSDYSVFGPRNSTKNKPDFELLICTDNILNNKGFSNRSNIYATCSDDVSFYNINNIDLPSVEIIFLSK